MKPRALRFLPIGLVLAAAGTCAADLGVLGPTYGISEPHLLDYIQQRLREQERSGELQRLLREAQARGIVVCAASAKGLAEEAPLAYKDVDRVVNVVHRAGVARKVVRLRPLGVVKG